MNLFRRIALRLRSFFAGKKGLWYALALGGGLLTVMVLPAAAHAGTCGLGDPGSCVAMIFIKIFQLLTALMGFIMIMEVDALIKVAQYFNFVSPGPSAVRIGWIVTRDLANMFFIVVLLIIAFGTIFDLTNYNYKSNLQRLLIMAVVINFSKTICGLFIDMGQVVMLTFVNGFKDAAAGNFLTAFQINKVLSLSGGQGDGDFGLVLAMMLAFVIVATATAVVLVMLVMMTFRVVMLWVLIVLSPLAFMVSAIPEGKNKYAEWWSEFKKNIMAGPILAFFLWLALASVQSANGNFATENQDNGGFGATTAAGAEVENAAAAGAGQLGGSGIPTDAGRADTILSLVIATSILFAGLKFAGDSGAVGSGFAKTVRGQLEKTGRALAYGGAKRVAQPFMTGGGKVLSRIPLVGGLGRAAVLTGEKWKKERQAGIEKYTGTAEDMARLSPGAFKRQMSKLADKDHKLDPIDKKRLGSMLDIASKDPKLAKSITDSGDGGFVLDTLIRNSSGKDLQDNIGRMMTDKNAQRWAKSDPELLGNAYDKANLEAYEHDGNGSFTLDADGKRIVKDPNMLKTISDLEQKFAPQLIASGKLEKDKLKNIVPKMSSDDIGGLAAGDMSTFMPHMNASQMRKLAQDGTPDQRDGMLNALASPDLSDKDRNDMLAKLGTGDIPSSWYSNPVVADNVLERTKGDAKARAEAMAKGGPALSARADARLAEEMAGRSVTRPDGTVEQVIDVDKILASLPDAINAGTLTADKILNDPKLQGYISNNPGKIDLASLARNNTPATREAAQALTASVIHADPDRKDRMKGEMYQDIRPSKTMMDRVGGEDTLAQARETAVAQTKALEDFGDALADAKKQLKTLQGSILATQAPTPGAVAAYDKLERVVRNLDSANEKKNAALNEKKSVEERVAAMGPGAGGPQFEALSKQLASINETLQKTDQDILKGMVALKGGGKV